MPYKIITYETADQLMHPDSEFLPYRDAIHITATNSLKQGIVNNNDDFRKWIGDEVYSFSELSQTIGDGWFAPSTELHQYTILSQVLHQFSDEEKVRHHPMHGAIDKDQETVLSTIRFLRESGITSRNLSSLATASDEEQTFYYAVKEMERLEVFKKFDDWIDGFSDATLDVFEDALVELVDKGKENRVDNERQSEAKHIVKHLFRSRKVIVLHGFYFLMPIQKMIFDRLSEWIEVIHVVNYIEGYERGFEPVEKFLDMKNTTHVKALRHNYPINIHAKNFLGILNGMFDDEVEGDIYRFTNLYQFRKYIADEDHVLVSPRAGTLKGYMEDPDSPRELQLSRYPFGSFLLDIHRLNVGRYDVVDGEYKNTDEVTADLLQRIFSSGFLLVKGKSSKIYLTGLRRISPLIEKNASFEQWYEELGQIKEQRKVLTKEFGIPDFERRQKNERNLKDHHMYNHPFESIGHLSVQDEEIDGIIEGMQAIETLYQKLFNSNEGKMKELGKVDIESYVELLDGHIQSEILPHITQEADKRIVESVREALDDLKDSPIEIVQREDLLKGLNFFLGGTPHEDEYAAEMRGGHRASTNSVVSPMLNSDGLQFDINRNIHFCLMDQKAFPYTQSLNLWPLKKESYDELFRINVNLRQLKMKKELEFEIACYLFYIMMCHAVHIKFSFIQEVGQEKGLSPSYYLELMGLKSSRPPEIEGEDSLPSDEDEGYATKRIDYHERVFHIMQHETYLRCKRRALYSFLLNDRPVFESGFHGGFTFENLLHFGKERSRAASDSRFNIVSRAFPHLTEMEKQMSRDHHDAYWLSAEHPYDPGFVMLDGIRYRDRQQNLTVFGSKKNKDKRKFQVEDFDNVDVKPSPGEHCKYCPYQMICRDAHVNTR